MKKRFRYLLSVIMIATLFSSASITSCAKSNLSVLKSGHGWHELSAEDQEDTIKALVAQVSKSLGLKSIPDVSCYRWPGGAAAAYNNMPWINQICVNMSTFDDDVDATLAGETVEYHIVKIIAHEVRHTYQAEHMNDDTDYGRAVLANQSNYISYSNDLGGYYAQFVEADADAYGVEYANKYVKNGKLSTTKLIASNGKVFDAVFYANKYPDVKKALGTDSQTLLNHYNTFGISEGRMANANDK